MKIDEEETRECEDAIHTLAANIVIETEKQRDAKQGEIAEKSNPIETLKRQIAAAANPSEKARVVAGYVKLTQQSSVPDIAQALKVSKSSLYRWLEKEPALKAEIEAAKRLLTISQPQIPKGSKHAGVIEAESP